MSSRHRVIRRRRLSYIELLFLSAHWTCPLEAGILVMFTGIYSVKGGRLFKAATFYDLTVVFSVTTKSIMKRSQLTRFHHVIFAREY